MCGDARPETTRLNTSVVYSTGSTFFNVVVVIGVVVFVQCRPPNLSGRPTAFDQARQDVRYVQALGWRSQQEVERQAGKRALPESQVRGRSVQTITIVGNFNLPPITISLRSTTTNPSDA